MRLNPLYFFCGLFFASHFTLAKKLGVPEIAKPSGAFCALLLSGANDVEDFAFLDVEAKYNRLTDTAVTQLAELRRSSPPAIKDVVNSVWVRGPEATSIYTKRLLISLLAHGDKILVEQAARDAVASNDSNKRLEFVARLWRLAYEKRLAAKRRFLAQGSNKQKKLYEYGYEDIFTPVQMGRSDAPSLPSEIKYYRELKAIIPNINGEIVADEIKDNEGYLVWQDRDSKRNYYYIIDHDIVIFCLQRDAKKFATKKGLPYNPVLL